MTTEQTALVKTEPTSIEPFNAFGSIQHFEAAQRMAKALCSSSIVPENYRGDSNLGNCVIAMEIANRVGANILAVMQNLYVVHGKPAWSSQFLISCVNASRKFTPLRYQMTGSKADDTYGCIAWATDRTGERLESPEITVGIAKAEGWYSKNGSKWKTMPELMLRYRCATLFARLYAPELTMGIQTDDEVIDVGVVDTAPVVTEPSVKKPNFPEPPIEPEVLPSRLPRKKKESTPTPAPEPVVAETVAPEVPAPEQPEKSFEEMVDGVAPAAIEDVRFGQIRSGLEKNNILEAQCFAWLAKQKLLVEGEEGFASIREDKVDKLIEQLSKGDVSPVVKGMKEMKA